METETCHVTLWNDHVILEYIIPTIIDKNLISTKAVTKMGTEPLFNGLEIELRDRNQYKIKLLLFFHVVEN